MAFRASLTHLPPVFRLALPCFFLLAVPAIPRTSAMDSPVPPGCAKPVLELLQRYRVLTETETVAGGDLLTALEDAIITYPDCAPALTGVTVNVLDGEDDMIRRVIQTAIEIVPEQAEAIVRAAKDASRGSDEAIAMVSRDTFGDDVAPPDSLTPTTGASAPAAQVSPALEDITAEDFLPAPKPAPVSRIRFPTRRVDEIGKEPVVTTSPQPPLELSVSIGGGYDSNAATSTAPQDSAFLRAGLGAKVRKVLGETRLDLAADYTLLNFFESADGLRRANSTAGLDLTVGHGTGGRWSILEELSIDRDTEPDLLGAVTTATREPGYLSLYNRISTAFEASPLWTIGAGYTVQGIDYSGTTAARAEERFSQAVGLESRHGFLGVIDLTASYQAEFTDYHQSELDFTRHSVLAGFDSPVGNNVRASAAGGAQFRDGGSGGSRSTPLAETSLDWTPAPGTDARWIQRYGQFDHELALLGFDQREGYLTRIVLGQQAGERLRFEVTAGVLASRFTGSAGGLDETAMTATVGATWQLVGDVDLNVGYHFVRLESPVQARAYDRHQVGLGLTRQF